MRVDITTTRKKYRVIYADPPWKFSSKEATGKTRGGVISTTYKPLEAVYPTMTTEALKELDVGRIAHRDAALFMWATDAHIPDALELYRAWGFRYVTVAFVWSKKTVNGKTVSNLAPWTLKNCELCLIEGSVAKVEACNNAFDDSPAWEDITAQVAINRVYNFLNESKTAEKWGVNVRFTITKNEGYEEEVSISGFGGAYE